MGSWNQLGKHCEARVSGQPAAEVYPNLQLCKDPLWLERGGERAGTRHESTALHPHLMPTQHREKVLFKVQCKVYHTKSATSISLHSFHLCIPPSKMKGWGPWVTAGHSILRRPHVFPSTTQPWACQGFQASINPISRLNCLYVLELKIHHSGQR